MFTHVFETKWFGRLSLFIHYQPDNCSILIEIAKRVDDKIIILYGKEISLVEIEGEHIIIIEKS